MTSAIRRSLSISATSASSARSPARPARCRPSCTAAISTGPQGNRIYFGYGTNKGGVLQIVDREKLLKGPKEPTPDNLRYPEISRVEMLPFNGAHTVFPMLQMPVAEFAQDKDGRVRDIVMIVDEQILQRMPGRARQMVWFVDVTVESQADGGLELHRP